MLAVAGCAACGIGDQGWLIWTKEGLRRAFRLGFELERQLIALLPKLEKILCHSGSIRWGMWIDQYVIPFDGENRPVIKNITASAIFNFEPDDMLLSAEAIYQANRSWEYFVGAPRRLLDGQEHFGYRMVSHKRPSALDHNEAKDPTPFVGRRRELSEIEKHWAGDNRSVRLAITAAAGSGKTRLIKEWLRRHRGVRALTANFSLFGGAFAEFISQLVELPADRLDCGGLVEAVLSRVRRDNIDLLVLDDLHWADAGGLEFLQKLVTALEPIGPLVILAARPSGRKQLEALQPLFELELSPLPKPAMEEFALRLGASGPVAVAAALRSRGNPLFVEQFVAWAREMDFCGGSSGPNTLHQIVAARIERLSNVRIADLQQRLRWGRSWERQYINDELGQLEAEVGRWLDRLETGDYANRVEVAHHLVYLERLDYEIFLTSMLLSQPRPRSSRLREAIERLLIGSADQILVDLNRRSAKATGASKENIAREAKRAADALFAACNWSSAVDFYELAHSKALWDKDEIARQLAQCRRHSRAKITDGEVISDRPEQNLNETPRVDTRDLPYVWADLGRRFRRSIYFVRASEAAETINDRALAVWARRKAEELCRK
jgi:AAA ATPase domain